MFVEFIVDVLGVACINELEVSWLALSCEIPRLTAPGFESWDTEIIGLGSMVRVEVFSNGVGNPDVNTIPVLNGIKLCENSEYSMMELKLEKFPISSENV